VVIGTALYTSNFTPSTEPLTAISGTELLICTSNNLEDEGPNKITFTKKGNPQVSSSSPFTGNTGEGGLVWFKMRDQGFSHRLVDTARGVTKKLETSNDAAEGTEGQGLTSFNSNGFTVGSTDNYNLNNADLCSWTFRKAPKFFDIVTWTGDGTSPRNISHSLGSQPGMMIVKRTSSAEDWTVYHRSLGATKYLNLNGTQGAQTFNQIWADTEPTSTQFTVGNTARVNTSGQTYVAYLFAHNNSDGEFGPSSDQDIIKCGSYTGNTSTKPNIDLGFEPQWLMVKNTSSSNQEWQMIDTMRGWYNGSGVSGGGVQDARLRPNANNAEETTFGIFNITPTGFEVGPDNLDETNKNGDTYIYMAIRRGPLAEPTSATDVFAVAERGADSPPPLYRSNFVTDMFINRADVTLGGHNYVLDRLRGKLQVLLTAATDAEAAYGGAAYGFDVMDGIGNLTGLDSNNYSWMWKRAPGYFDVCCYSGTGSAMTVNHNLGVVPEMMWVKKRSAADHWIVYHKGLNGGTDPEDYYVSFSNGGGTPAEANFPIFNDTAPTSSVFSLGNYTEVSGSGITYIAYLFATVAGVSKVGSYTGDSSDGKVIDCGFSNGAKFVMIKCTTTTGDWFVFDTERGIVAGNDAKLALNNTDAEVNSYDYIDPHSSGFAVNTIGSAVNGSGKTFIFYAIAA